MLRCDIAPPVRGEVPAAPGLEGAYGQLASGILSAAFAISPRPGLIIQVKYPLTAGTAECMATAGSYDKR